MALIASIATAVTIGGGLIMAHQEGQAQKGFANDANGRAAEIRSIEANRQAVPNPFEGFENVSSMAEDLSGMMSNPYLNLGVATQAAEIQMEESDLALAATLDTLRATGASAGGATALANAALKSKKGVSATIEKQEADNAKLAARGEESLQAAKISEATRLQGVQMSEAQRMQEAEAQGIDYEFKGEEDRTMQQLNRLAGQQAQSEANAAQANANQNAAYAGIASGIGNIASSFSDRRLKKNIKSIGVSDSGLKIYSFEYIDKNLGDGIFQGVMSDEIPQEAVIPFDGYDLVDYSRIDVEFKKIA